MIRKLGARLTGLFAAAALLLTPVTAWAQSVGPVEPASVQAQDTGTDITEDAAEVQRYMTTRNGEPYFNTAQAKALGASERILRIGELVNDYSAQMANKSVRSADFDVIQTYDGLPLWGNWCGPGHGGGTPVDTLDALCQAHDQCYGVKGYFDCDCDQALIEGIEQYSSRMDTGERAMATAISVYFTVAFCNPF